MTTEKRKTLFARASLLAVVALAAGVLLNAGVASAKYFRDGAVQNGATGSWNLPTDFVCIVGLNADGTMSVAAGVTSSRDCIYYNTGLKGMNPVDVTASSMCGAGGTLACNVAANCTGTNTVTKGTLTWNSTDSKCYDSAPCTVAGFTAGSYGGVAFPANTGGKHSLATSICVDGSGNGVSLTGLDRTAQMCAAKGGIWKQTSATAPAGFPGTFPTAGFGGACVAYTRQFKGQDANGTPLPFGPKGTDSSVVTSTGFCYTSMNWTAVYSTATCPSLQATTSPYNVDAAYDWSVASSQCRYAKSIAGKLASALTKADGTTIAAGTYVDFSVGTGVGGTPITTMGDCLALGASWNNWVGKAAPISAAGSDTLTYTRPNWDYQTQAPDADDGCLHCHSTTVEYNGPAERFKSSYIMTGHKNMLRKVTAGENWAGPDANGVLQIYTAYSAGTLNFTSATAQVSGVDKPLLYIFGDWMAPAPPGLDVIVNIGGFAKYNGVSNYSCAPCHSTGWSDNGTAAASRIGLCVPSSGGTTQAACTGAGGIWYPAIGVKGIGNASYVPQEPAASFPGITFAGAGQWDLEGVTCARCHNAAVGPLSSQALAASQFPTTYLTSGGMGNIPGGPEAAGPYGVFLCYGCHQQIAKNSNGVGADNDLAHPENLPVANAVTTGSCSDPTKASESTCQGAGGIWTPTAYVPTFAGAKHVLGGSFLNSAHAEATGTIVPNSLGKYDLVTNLACTGSGTPYPCCTGAGAGTCISFGSSFKGFTCWQGSSSTSPALTWIDTSLTTQAGCEAAEGELESVGCVREIKDKTTCETMYGVGSWRAASQGSCVTCHDVHNSLFVAGQEEKALRKICQNCHVDNATTFATDPGAPQVVIAGINHLTGSGTPFDPAMGESPCVVCHMPRPTPSDFPMHLWRINTDVNYSTFPTAAQYGAGTVPTKKIANASPDGSYTNAVWVDIDLACGQCHGGGTVEDAQHQSKLSLCTAPGVPDPCCTGPGTGSCANYRNKAVLAGVAATMHEGAAVTYPTTFSTATNGMKVNMYASVDCNGCSPTCEWTCGDGVTAQVGADTCNDASCTYPGAGTKSITLDAMLNGGQVGTSTRYVTLSAPPAAPPVPGGMTCGSLFNANTWTASFTDASAPLNARVLVDWGDGSVDAMPAGSAFSHTYRSAGTYLVVQKVVTSTPQVALAPPCSVSTAGFQIDGHVYKTDGTTGLGSATVSVRSSTTGATVRTVYTASNGYFSVASLKPDTYWLIVNKRGYTFNAPADTVTVGGDKLGRSVVATGP